MGQGSMKSVAELLQPIKGYVSMCWNSPKRDFVFCLVEGTFDKRVYEKLFSKDRFEVKIAVDDKLSHNRSSVQYLVSDLYEMHPNGHFLGIRDKDYMTLLGNNCPNHIFATDRRDLEMMILESESFHSTDPNLGELLQNIESYCLQMAYIRIFAESRQLRNKLNKKMKITMVYDQNQKTFIEDANTALIRNYFEKVDSDANEDMLDSFVTEHNLRAYSFYDMCRGHDVVGLLEFVHGGEYSRINMENRMVRYYNTQDFHATELYNSVHEHCHEWGINA